LLVERFLYKRIVPLRSWQWNIHYSKLVILVPLQALWKILGRFVLKVAKEHTPTCKPERHDKESILRIFPGAKPISIVSGDNRSNLGRPFQFTPYR